MVQTGGIDGDVAVGLKGLAAGMTDEDVAAVLELPERLVRGALRSLAPAALAGAGIVALRGIVGIAAPAALAGRAALAGAGNVALRGIV